jgi:hypothetical protein
MLQRNGDCGICEPEIRNTDCYIKSDCVISVDTSVCSSSIKVHFKYTKGLYQQLYAAW